MEAYGGRAPETFSDPVPDMVKQFVVYLYRHIRYSTADQIVLFEATPCAPDHCKRNAAYRSCLNCKAWCCRERNIREIFSMYDVSFAKLSERFFKTTSWPPVHMIADLVDGDHVFCLLYKASHMSCTAPCIVVDNASKMGIACA